VLFTQIENEVQMRQQTTLSFFKVRQLANQRPSSSWGLFDKTTLQIVPKNGLLLCTSSLQVLCQFYKSSL